MGRMNHYKYFVRSDADKASIPMGALSDKTAIKPRLELGLSRRVSGASIRTLAIAFSLFVWAVVLWEIYRL